MENRRDRTVTIAVVAGVVALLLGLCLGAVAGGLGGYFIGRGAAPQAAAQSLQPRITPQSPRAPALLPTPQSLETPQIPQLPNLLRGGGALVQEVVKGTPAEDAGIKVGDVITKVDDTPMDATHRLGDVVAGHTPGDRVTLTVWRAGETRTIKVKLGENPDGTKRAYLGIRYVEMTPQQPTPTPKQ
ncbi:MAG: PDZ domain-containing protein [Chloroflexi bacterium]|nr:PDZ domain-containing protein [Chloroflexota bacterium]